MARGGKTTFLLMLFDRLKAENYAPICISFNGDFASRPKETHRHAILRLIANELLEQTSDMLNITVSEERLLNYIDTTCGGKPVVLLIDELNSLCANSPLGQDASLLLKAQFLDKAGRYLVFTTHVPMEVDSLTTTTTFMTSRVPASHRKCLTVPMPFSLNVDLLRTMSSDCNALTGAEVALYSGIPSIIYSVKTNGETSPTERFKRQRIDIRGQNSCSTLSEKY
jgi:hypothetical protein